MAVQKELIQEIIARPLSPAAAAPPHWEGFSSFPFPAIKVPQAPLLPSLHRCSKSPYNIIRDNTVKVQ
eukprot:1153224-Pelagomonas_calceolata.AAC.2